MTGKTWQGFRRPWSPWCEILASENTNDRVDYWSVVGWCTGFVAGVLKMNDKRTDAESAVDFVRRCMMTHHRGVIECERGVSYVLFENRGCVASKQRVLDLLPDFVSDRCELSSHDDAYSWAIVIHDYAGRQVKFDD